MEHIDVNSCGFGVGGMETEHTSLGSLNISDVIEVIQTTDPEFDPNASTSSMIAMDEKRKQSAYVRIVEQPASKALRFRYECEGRSAGSIPGVNSTPENKTYPTIQVMGYKGRAVVVVSCVTKEPPYRPHPHNLVGKDGCKKGVCTVEINSENMAVSFSNLGIQCVKKKDIEEALRIREQIRVDPYRTGFSHQAQPTSIDLNAVRLCFQVFLEDGQTGKFKHLLPPVISDPIYDKKAMSDLVICKLSDCSCSVAGGKEIILLCEKVAKEDIQVRFFEERDGQLVWEGYGDFQPSQVHKQVAVSFRTPRYHTLDISAPVKAFIQLRRPSDGAASEAVPFEFLPLDSGRPTFWSLRKAAAAKKGNYAVFSNILASNTAMLTTNPWSQKQEEPTPATSEQTLVSQNVLPPVPEVAPEPELAAEPESSPKPEPKFKPEPEPELEKLEVVIEEEEQKETPDDYADVKKWVAETDDNGNVEMLDNEAEETCRSLNELLSQCAELDEIYSDTRARLQDTNMNLEELCDEQTYSSLQLAMKNPVKVATRYDDINDRLPPLPPKRIRKSPPAPPARPEHHSPPPLEDAPNKSLPEMPTPTNKHAKTSLFQKLFSKKNKAGGKKEAGLSREGSVGNVSLSTENRKDSVGNVSLMGSRKGSVGNVSVTGSQKDGPRGELTEAEHLALYTDMAPYATASEFDEMSFYYSPVEGGKILEPQPKRDVFT